MIREIMRDEAFLAQKAEPAALEDLPVAQDLLDTLEANKGRCVGMAANMIGISMSTPTRNCRFSPKPNDIFRRSA